MIAPESARHPGRPRETECSGRRPRRRTLRGLPRPIELANGYHELLDADEQERRFKAEQQARAEAGRAVPPFDAHLVDALRAGMPACSGVALGVDRLLGCLTGLATISESLSFAHQRA